MPMDIKVNVKAVEDKAFVIEVQGEIDVYTSPRVKESINDLIEKGNYSLVINLEGVRYIDSTGLGVLIGALKKVRELGRASGRWTLADDSGLEVPILNNAPGVYSARYAGDACSYPANNAKLLRELEGLTDRRARFRCVIALRAPDGREWTVEGRCEGRIIEAARGQKGFGYDPLFVPDGHDRTFAELEGSVKNALSHRGHALRRALAEWGGLLNQERRKEGINHAT